MDRLGENQVWLYMYIGQIIIPMLGLVSIAIKILVRNGRDMRRELLGVDAVPVKAYNQQKITRKVSVASISVGSASVIKAVDFFNKSKF